MRKDAKNCSHSGDLRNETRHYDCDLGNLDLLTNVRGVTKAIQCYDFVGLPHPLGQFPHGGCEFALRLWTYENLALAPFGGCGRDGVVRRPL
jgi:hypothetical protein